MTRIGYFAGLLLFCSVCLAQAAPMIRVSEPVWNVGIIVNGKTYEKDITVENRGNEPLLIEKIEECCGFYGVLPESLQVLPGGKTNVRLQLSPFQVVGDLKAELFLFSNDPAQPSLSILATGQIVPAKHALGELTTPVIDLGRNGLRDRVPFTVRLKNSGNVPLEILSIAKPVAVVETGSRPVIAAGAEGELHFEYVPRQSGRIDEMIDIVTNDALQRSLPVQLTGQTLREYVSEQAIAIYPAGGAVAYDVMEKAYRFDFTVSNRGPLGIEIPMIESSIQGAKVEISQQVAAGESVKGRVVFPHGAAAAPATGYIYLQLAIPIELR